MNMTDQAPIPTHRPRLATALPLVAALLLTTPGCATRNDPHYNRYAPHNGRPTVLDRGEHCLDYAADRVDDLEERFDNLVD